MKQKNWHGTDRSNEVSLFEYGFLVRNVAKENNLQVCYKINDRFFWSWFDAEEWIDDLKKNDGTKNFPNPDDLTSVCDEPSEGWLKFYSENHEFFLSDLLSVYGTENIFGSEYWEGLTEPQIRQRLNKAL